MCNVFFRVRFVLNDYSDDPDTSVSMVGQNVPLPTEMSQTVSLDSDSFRRC